jgi:hypothetical protein
LAESARYFSDVDAKLANTDWRQDVLEKLSAKLVDTTERNDVSLKAMESRLNATVNTIQDDFQLVRHQTTTKMHQYSEHLRAVIDERCEMLRAAFDAQLNLNQTVMDSR